MGTRMKKKDAQMCELRYEKKIDVKNTDLKKLRVKELRKIADDEGIDVKGLVEKEEFIKKIHAHFGSSRSCRARAAVPCRRRPPACRTWGASRVCCGGAVVSSYERERE